MLTARRYPGNPIIKPGERSWEKLAAFNGSIIENDGKYFLVYRAMSDKKQIGTYNLNLSVIGAAKSDNRIDFYDKHLLIFPEKDWEKYGCEDPRINFIEGKYYIFYTALSEFPPNANGIKIAVAVTKDMNDIIEKHQVTTFNSKAMAMFPRKINGKYLAVLTVHTDLPPAKIALASFDNLSDLWDKNYWDNWYKKLNNQIIPLLRSKNDHIEVGAQPVETEEGWLLVYCYIRNYKASHKTFGIEAVLLDKNNPQKIVGRTAKPLLKPEYDYELNGQVSNVIFPTGVLIHNNSLGIYYGAADTTVCLATVELDELLSEMVAERKYRLKKAFDKRLFIRHPENPIIEPIPEHSWESKFTLNPAAFYDNGKVHIIYRAQGEDYVSTMGYATSKDGFHIDERLSEPIYVPREPFEISSSGGFSGCEDPRFTRIGDRYYVCYTAYDAKNPTRVGFSSILVSDFMKRVWKWDKPKLISPPGMNDKDACVFPEKVNGKYVFLHRLYASIWIDYVDDLTFSDGQFLRGDILFGPRVNKWDSEKIGIGPPPIKTTEGWLLFYHAMSITSKKYRMGAVLLDLDNPSHVLKRTPYAVLEPFVEYEHAGLRPGTVFADGVVIMDDTIFLYYGAADQVVCVAYAKFHDIMDGIKNS